MDSKSKHFGEVSYTMLFRFKALRQGLSSILFPKVCELCGVGLSATEQFICSDCLGSRFELANPFNKMASSDVLLPEGVSAQHALWVFDKGGYLQDLLHKLKYSRLSGVGVDLGTALGNSVRRNGYLQTNSETSILVPVPLHRKKKRKRGYNQARYIAKGVQKVLEIPACKTTDILRVKNTKTQTGFTLEKRRQNIANAFRVMERKEFSGKSCFIVDDVFTTGATTFELATALINAGAAEVLIITVAQA